MPQDAPKRWLFCDQNKERKEEIKDQKKKEGKKQQLKTKSHQDNDATKSHPMLIHILISSFFTTGQSLCLITSLL